MREKKGSTAIMQLFEILLMALLLLAFLVLVTSLLSAFTGGEEGVVKLNTELLRAKISDACSLRTTAEIRRLAIPQSTPYPTAAHRLFDFPGFLARAHIKVTGDPKYVLYYEAFPAGEAVGWEVYHDFDYRIVAPFEYPTREQTINFVDFERELYSGSRSHVEKSREAAGRAGVQPTSQTGQVAVIANNIMLSSQLNPIANQEPKTFSPGNIPRAGEWKEKTTDRGGNIIAAAGDNKFEFSSYTLLTSLEQTALKYRSCGENYLCLKTQDGVERFALPESCDNRKLEYIQLEYDNRAVLTANVAAGVVGIGIGVCAFYTAGACITVPAIAAGKLSLAVSRFLSRIPGGTIAGGAAVATAAFFMEKAVGKLLQAFLAYKASDFYLASPCIVENVEIQQVECGSLCRNWMKYPLYEVFVDGNGERKYRVAGEHYQCIDSIEGSAAGVQAPQGACLRVKIKSSTEGFCWTADPTKKISATYLQGFTDFQTRAVASFIGFTPVKDASLYIQNPAGVVLKPKDAAEKSLIPLKDWFERRYTWGWPGSGEKLVTSTTQSTTQTRFDCYDGNALRQSNFNSRLDCEQLCRGISSSASCRPSAVPVSEGPSGGGASAP